MDEDMTVAKAVMDKNGLHFEDPALIDKASRAKVSNSLITGMLKCPARQAADKWILPDVLPVDPLSPAVLGSAFHKVMEIFYGYPPKERTLDAIKQAYRDMLKDDEFKAVNESDEAKKWVRHRVKEYWNDRFEDPSKVRIAQVEKEGKYGKYLVSGLELYIQDNIGNSTRPTCGFIDRLSVDDNGDYIVDDWKTGKNAHVFNPKDKYPDFSLVRQQVIYTLILENTTDRDVNTARLIYPDTKHVDDSGATVNGGLFVDTIPVHNKKYRDRAIRDVETVSRMLDDCNETNTWPAEPSPLCSWCPLVNICPNAKKIAKQNAVEAREAAPSRDMLAEGGIVAA